MQRMEVETETETSTVAAEMAAALEQATLMAKQLPTTTDPSQLLRILTTLHSAHHRLSLFLSNHPPTPPPENSISSAVDGGGEPMLTGDDEEEHNSDAVTSSAVEKVAGRMRECFIQNKRPKRPLSASAEMRRQSFENEAEMDGPVDGPAAEFDPHGNKSRALDLIYQFHA